MMYVCILNNRGKVLVHKNIPTVGGKSLKLIALYREFLIIGVAWIFSWYCLADLRTDEGIEFILSHMLYMRDIHGGKIKNDKLDAGTRWVSGTHSANQ